jgi:Cu-processing system permease protein
MRADSPLAIVLLCAKQERLLAMRSRWTQLFAIVFGALALAIAASGYVLSGGFGVQDFARTAASMIELVLLVVPLASSIMGVLAMTPERGGAELLYAQPIARASVLLGTWLGLFEALVAAQMVGFGAAGLVIFWQSGDEGLAGYGLVVLAAVLLTAVFLSIATLISIGQVGRRRVRALAIALIAWCAIALVFDVAALGAASLLRSGDASRLLIVSALVNPIDAVRTGALLGVEGTAAFGPASLALLRFTHGATGAAALILLSIALWITAPAALAMRRLSRIDII